MLAVPLQEVTESGAKQQEGKRYAVHSLSRGQYNGSIICWLSAS